MEFWKYFREISAVPRCSYHTDKIAAWLMNFADVRGLENFVDGVGNVIIRKKASAGYENHETVVLQGHMDMVPQVDEGFIHDFTRDPITLIEEDGWLHADHTTLGADNGVAIAAMLAVLDDDKVAHPALECLFTNDEEVGMIGAFGLSGDVLRGRRLINLDSEKVGTLVVGCCGGRRGTATFGFEREQVPEGDVAYMIGVKGLRGGHSGLDIHLQRANGIKLVAHMLKSAIRDVEARLASIDGGSVANAIPNNVAAIVTIPTGAEDDLYQLIADYQEIYNKEYGFAEPVIELYAEPVDVPSGLIPECVQDDVVNALVATPNGAYRMLYSGEGVETSNNIGVITTTDDAICVKMLMRSPLVSMRGEIESMIGSIYSLAGAAVVFDGDYNGWNPDYSSVLLKTTRESYSRLFCKEPAVVVDHAGLECGIFTTNYPDMDMISFGPELKHPHSTLEKLNIASVDGFISLLEAVLAEL